MQNVSFYRLLIFCACQGFLQDIGQQLPEGAMLRRTRALLVFPVDEADVDGLTNEVEQVFSRKIDETRAQENVLMDVVSAQR